MPGCWLKSCPVNEEPLRVCANRRMCFRVVAALVSSGMRLSSQRDFHLCSGEEKKKKWDNTALNLRGHYKATKDPISSASSLINHLFGYENTRSCNLGKRHHIISTKTLIKSSAIQKPILPTEMYSSNNVVLKTWIASFCGGNHFTFWSNIWKKHIQLKYEQWVHFSTYEKRLCDFCSKWTITIYSRRVGETDNACDYGWWETDCVWHIRLCESTLAGSANSWSVRTYYGRLTMR